MKIDNLNNAAFEGVERTRTSTTEPVESTKSLSAPFTNPYSFNGTSTKGVTAAERNNNPFNIKFGNFAQQYGAIKENKAALDGGSFARFPNVEAGMTAAKGLLLGKNYRNLTVDAAMRRWSNNGYGGDVLPQVANKKVADLSTEELDTLQRNQIIREDRKYAQKLGLLKKPMPKLQYDNTMKASTTATNLPVYKYGGKIGEGSTGIQKPYNTLAKSPNYTGRENSTDLSKSPNIQKINKDQESKDKVKLSKERGYTTGTGRTEPVYPEVALFPGTPVIKGLGKVGNIALDALNPVSGLLSNTYKINPLAKGNKFNKTNPNSFFRQVDEATHLEAKSSGLIKGKQDIVKQEGAINLQRAFGDDAYYKKGSLYYPEQSKVPYLYEVNKSEDAFIPKVNGRTKKYTTENTDIRVSKNPIPLNESKVYKHHWLKGYKEIPKYRYGGKIKKMEVGGITPKAPKVSGEGFQLDSGMLSTGLGIAGAALDTLDNDPRRVNKGVSIGAGALKGAAAGAQLGSVVPGWGTAVGAAAGAVIGGVTSGIKAKKRQRLIDTNLRNDQRSFNSIMEDRSRNLYAQLQPQVYRYGGKVSNKPVVSSSLSIAKNPKSPLRLVNDNEVQDFTEMELGNIFVNNKYPEVNLNAHFKETALLKKSDGSPRAYNDNNNIFIEPKYAREEIPAELAHSEQYRKMSTVGHIKRNFIDNRKSKGNREKTYDIPGTVEYEAHKVIEPKIQKEYDNYTEDLLNQKYTRNNTLSKRLGRKKPIYKYGGNMKTTPEYEAEKDEIIQGQGVQLEAGRKITSNLHEVKGNTHEQGGTLGSGGDRIFSNSISFNGKTPATLVKSIGNKLKKIEPNLSSKDTMKRKTAEIMSDQYNKEIDQIFDMQESSKVPTYKYGGNLPKYAEGGDIEADRRRIKSVEKYLKDHPQESADSRRSLQAEINKLRNRSNTPKYTGAKPWNPLDKSQTNTSFNGKSKLGIPITKDFYAGNNLDEVVIKGKRDLPVKNNSGAAKKSTLPKITRNQYSGVNNNLSIKQSAANPLANQLTGKTSNLANLTKPLAVNNNTAQRRGLDIDPNVATGIGLSAIGFLNSAKNINQMQTNVPAYLTSAPTYNYRDRSQVARQDLNANANTILNNPNVSSAQKQALFSRLGSGVNQINAQENENRYQYDQNFANQELQINARNNAVLGQATQQRIENENAKLGLKSNNFSSLLGNINTTLSENEARKLDKKKFDVLSNSYKSRYNTNFDVNI